MDLVPARLQHGWWVIIVSLQTLSLNIEDALNWNRVRQTIVRGDENDPPPPPPPPPRAPTPLAESSKHCISAVFDAISSWLTPSTSPNWRHCFPRQALHFFFTVWVFSVHCDLTRVGPEVGSSALHWQTVFPSSVFRRFETFAKFRRWVEMMSLWMGSGHVDSVRARETSKPPLASNDASGVWLMLIYSRSTQDITNYQETFLRCRSVFTHAAVTCSTSWAMHTST